MPKYMIKASYTPEGVQGLIKDGGTARRAVVQQLVEGMGGTLEACYFAHGADDLIAICDLPDGTSGLAINLAVNASGKAHASSVPLITPEEMDAAAKRVPVYRAPGA